MNWKAIYINPAGQKKLPTAFSSCAWASCLIAGVFLFVHENVQGETGAQAWVRQYGFDGRSSTDTAIQLATDSLGNVVVVGQTTEGNTGYDMLIIKYSSVGVPLWTNRYNGLVNQDDGASSVAVDADDNIFVTGILATGGQQYEKDFATLAFSPTGVPRWTNLFNGPGNSFDNPTAINVDGGGNVLVTGYSAASGGGGDYATIKYSGAGVPLWTNFFKGPGNNTDFPNAMVVDGNGNVFVTGYSGPSSFPGPAPADYVTVAYSSAGLPLWTNLYDGPSNGDDKAKAIAVDAVGNVFVTGYSSDVDNIWDYTTIKYSTSGMPLWTNRYNGPGNSYDMAVALVANDTGTVFVTGWSGGSGSSDDYATIAYSNSGVPLWTNRYNGGANGSDVPTGVALGINDDVFVTGYSGVVGNGTGFATVKYSSAGAPLWTNIYDAGSGYASAYAIATDSSGHAIVTGVSVGAGGYLDCATVAYSGSGTTLWTNQFNGHGSGINAATAMAVHSSGNVYVTGRSLGIGDYYDYATIAYSGAGMPLWTNRCNPGSRSANSEAMAVSPGGNVFVVGSSWGSSADFATVGYSSSGVPMWTNLYDGPANLDDNASDMAVDATGNIFVTGTSWGGVGSENDYATIKYSSGGTPLWTNRYNGTASSEDRANAIAVDGSGNVFVTGASRGSGIYQSHDYLTIAYSGAGVPLWTNRYDGPQGSSDEAQAIAVDGNGNVFVTGNSIGDGTYGDYATIAYSSAGIPLWTNRYSGSGNGLDWARAIAVAGNGNVFVTGSSTASGNNLDYTTIAYSGAGVPLWTNHYNGTANGEDQATAVTVDTNGSVFVTGYSAGNGTGFDYATVKYSSTGIVLWTNRHNGWFNGEDRPQTKSCLAVGPDGATYVTGYSDSGYTTVKYVSQPQVAMHVLTATSLIVNLGFLGDPLSSWAIERAPAITGPWTNLGPLVIDGNGIGGFQDASSPPSSAFYRARKP